MKNAVLNYSKLLSGDSWTNTNPESYEDFDPVNWVEFYMRSAHPLIESVTGECPLVVHNSHALGYNVNFMYPSTASNPDFVRILPYYSEDKAEPFDVNISFANDGFSYCKTNQDLTNILNTINSSPYTSGSITVYVGWSSAKVYLSTDRNTVETSLKNDALPSKLAIIDINHGVKKFIVDGSDGRHIIMYSDDDVEYIQVDTLPTTASTVYKLSALTNSKYYDKYFQNYYNIILRSIEQIIGDETKEIYASI